MSGEPLSELLSANTIIIHPGSLYLRIGTPTTLHNKLRATLLTITNIQEEQVTPNQHKFSMPLREKGSLVEEATKTLYLCQRQSKCQTSHHLVIFQTSPSFPYSFVLTFDCPCPDQTRCCSSRLLGP